MQLWMVYDMVHGVVGGRLALFVGMKGHPQAYYISVGTIASGFTNGSKKWRDMLEVPATLFFWWLEIYVSFPTSFFFITELDKHTTITLEHEIEKDIAAFASERMDEIRRILRVGMMEVEDIYDVIVGRSSGVFSG